jgi:hypothetical protein
VFHLLLEEISWLFFFAPPALPHRSNRSARFVTASLIKAHATMLILDNATKRSGFSGRAGLSQGSSRGLLTIIVRAMVTVFVKEYRKPDHEGGIMRTL